MKLLSGVLLTIVSALILSCSVDGGNGEVIPGEDPRDLRGDPPVIYSGISWYDDNNNTVNAHGINIVYEDGKYYMFGEYKTNDINHFIGFSCYSSDDLVNWKFERIVLHQQASGYLGPNRIGERPKVMKCPSTGKKDGMYYLLSSGTTSWERNDNSYHTATNIAGPWTSRGLFAPSGTLTYNSQCSFVFPVQNEEGETTYMYIGDRWSFPKQGLAGTQVWQPLVANGTSLSIPEFWEGWDPQTEQKVVPFDGGIEIPQNSFELTWNWENDGSQIRCDVAGDTLRAEFKGTKIAIFGESFIDGGYAKVTILNKFYEPVFSTMVDFYRNKTNQGLRFISPGLPFDITINKIQYRTNGTYALPELPSVITGTVTNNQNAPLADVQITVDINSRLFEAVTGANGSYSIPVTPGRHFFITASKPGYQTKTLSNITVSDVYTADFEL